MPNSKTIEIDEIVTPDKAPGDSSSRASKTHGSAPADSATSPFPSSSGDPFADLEKALPWKARWTLKFTRWFMLLRTKPWGKLILVPAILLSIILAIPLGFLAVLFFIIRSFFRPMTRQT